MPRRHTLLLFLLAQGLLLLPALPAEEAYGPANLVKTMPTPFGPPELNAKPRKSKNEMSVDLSGDSYQSASGQAASGTYKLTIAPALGKLNTKPSAEEKAYAPIAIQQAPSRLASRLFPNRLVQSRLYLPGKMTLGLASEFLIKGKPSSLVALAMSEDKGGARPIYGHNLRLGADRKVVSVGTIPESGILSLFVGTPIEGDLIGQNLYFEAAVWSKPDFSDMEIALPVNSQGAQATDNGVAVAANLPHKRGPRIVPASSVPMRLRSSNMPTIDSGQP